MAGVKRIPIPKTRDPFVNTPLLPVGPDKQGRERFWMTTLNRTVGCLGALVNAAGEQRIYRFAKEHIGFYSAVAEDADTLWLCCWLDTVVRFRISTGKYEAFSTGAPNALCFQGMIFDRPSGKLFMAAYPPPRTVAFSFDTRTKKSVQVFENIAPAHYMRFSFPNGDGSYTGVLHIPGLDLIRWDPRSETVEHQTIQKQLDVKTEGWQYYDFISDVRGRWYFPAHGWFDPLKRTFDAQGPRPEREASWFERRGHVAYGVAYEPSCAPVLKWDLATDAVKTICTLPDTNVSMVRLTGTGKLVCISRYGRFSRYDAESGALEITRELPADAVGHVDCLCRIDKDRLLGTPFITQRFWEVNLRTKKGLDCGRAAPGGGEVLKTWKKNGKIYMAAYTGGELVEYDPRQHPNFPDNPRVVADPPHGMRPVAGAENGSLLYYACSAPYGVLGSVLTRYDTRSGETLYTNDPLPQQQIRALAYVKRGNALLCGTTFHADCESCPPATRTCYLARLGAADLKVQERVPAPEGTVTVAIPGPLDKDHWLVIFEGQRDGKDFWKWCAVSPQDLKLPAWDQLHDLMDGCKQTEFSGKPGRFALRFKDRVELWQFGRGGCKQIKPLLKRFDGYRIVVQDRALYAVRAKDILILEGAL